MGNKYIERMAINVIDSSFTTEYFYPNIPYNDCEPSYDGHINYQPNQDDKKDFRMIPVQVKGTTIGYDKKTFQMDVKDLHNFYSYGVLLLVVKFKNNKGAITEPKIYYRTLLKYDVEKIEKSLNKNQGTVSIGLQEMGTKTPGQICGDYLIRFNHLINYVEYNPAYGNIINIHPISTDIDYVFSYSKYVLVELNTGQVCYISSLQGKQTLSIFVGTIVKGKIISSNFMVDKTFTAINSSSFVIDENCKYAYFSDLLRLDFDNELNPISISLNISASNKLLYKDIQKYPEKYSFDIGEKLFSFTEFKIKRVRNF